MFKDWHKKDLKIGQPVYIVEHGGLFSTHLEVDTYIISDIKKTVLKCKKNNHEIKFQKGKATTQFLLETYSLYETKEEAQKSIELSNKARDLRNYIRDNAVYLTLEERIEIVKIMDKNKKIIELKRIGKIKSIDGL